MKRRKRYAGGSIGGWLGVTAAGALALYALGVALASPEEMAQAVGLVGVSLVLMAWAKTQGD